MRSLLHTILSIVLITGIVTHAKAQSTPKQLTIEANGCKFEMIYVHSGSCLIGSELPKYALNPKELAKVIADKQKLKDSLDHGGRYKQTFLDEMPQHVVELSSYFIGRYEVTQELWEAVMGYNPSNFKGPQHPVEQVSYLEVQTFIRRLNEITGLTFRLPTETEWEYAARGGDRGKGYEYPAGNNPTEIGWNRLNSEQTTHPVGSLIPNELGLYDMSGNVWEWCNDWYDPRTYAWRVSDQAGRPGWVKTDAQLDSWIEEAFGISTYYSHNYYFPIVNPYGLDTGSTRAGRGGSWADDAINLRPSYRNHWPPERKVSNVGFRLALSYNNNTLSHWMPKDYFFDSISEGCLHTSAPTEAIKRLNQGELNGLFSVAPDHQIWFSKGNLQYNAVSNTWRFAENQTDFIGDNNREYGPKYPGWIDLFTWGSSGNLDQPPTHFSTNSKHFGPRGNRSINGTKFDWGVNNPISNGGNEAGLWRTLTNYEWHYLFQLRPHAMGLRTQALVGNQGGIILLPDDWIERGLDSFQTHKLYIFEPQHWTVLERAGAVFLPAAGGMLFQKYIAAVPIHTIENVEIPIEGYNIPYNKLMPRVLEPVNNLSPIFSRPLQDLFNWEIDFIQKVQYREVLESNIPIGYYWTSIHYDAENAYTMYFDLEQHYYLSVFDRANRCSVRLVRDVTKPNTKQRR